MGWIKIDRGLLDSSIWNTGEPFTKGQAWIDLLLSANFEDTEEIVGYETIKVPRGSFMTTTRELSQRWRWSVAKTAQFLLFLTSQRMIKKNANTKRTLITIIKYSDFQDKPNTKRTQAERKPNTGRTQNENLLYKERREEGKNIRKGYFDNPDLEKAFLDFIEMRKAIKAPMTDRAIELAIMNLDKLAGDNDRKKIAIINQSIMHSWKGLFDIKEEQQTETLDDVLRRKYAEGKEMEGLNVIG